MLIKNKETIHKKTYTGVDMIYSFISGLYLQNFNKGITANGSWIAYNTLRQSLKADASFKKTITNDGMIAMILVSIARLNLPIFIFI